MILIDTNVVSELMRPAPEPLVLDWFRARPIEELAICAITQAEINYGLARLQAGRRRADLEARFRAFIERGFGERILPFDATAAELYGEMVAARQSKGRPFDAMDAMIAAIALSNAASVVTRNVTDFEEYGIIIINPWK